MNFSRPSSVIFWILWHSLAAISIVQIPSQFKYGVPAWSLRADERMVLVGLAISYFVCVVVLTIKTRETKTIRLIDLVSTFFAIFGSFFLLLLLAEAPYSPAVLIISLTLAAVFGLLSLNLNSALQKPALSIVTALVILVLVPGFVGKITGINEPAVEKKIITSSLYNVLALFYRNYFGMQKVRGGGLATFGEGYILATGDGSLHLFSQDNKKGELKTRSPSYRIPLNTAEFRLDASEGSNDGIELPNFETEWFRTADILLQDFGDRFRLFASHHYWNTDKRCFTVRVSATENDYSTFLAAESALTWETVFESEPCLFFKDQGHGFAGLEIGGRLALLDNHRLLLTIGDHEFDGENSTEILAQDEEASYGKTILINLDTREAHKYSMGHRNPQGLYVSPTGAIWLTEHGPKGGDELNLIAEGANYGWPFATHGTDYEKLIWPLNGKQGQHTRFEPPVYSWVPSIGISNLVGVKGKLFKLWQNDLLVSSLAYRSLWRIRLREGRIMYVEPILVGERIRDIIEDRSGRIVLWTDQGSVVFIEPIVADSDQARTSINTRAMQGELLFARCSGCHQLADGNTHGYGPDLRGVFQRKIATANGFNYSEALNALSGAWTERKLDAFLEEPKSFAPGTSMQSEGIRDPNDRADLIAYLKTQ